MDFNLQDLPSTPANLSHNTSARIIRNGLAVQCFNIFEDFVKARTGEILANIAGATLPFGSLPQALQMAATVHTIKAIDFQLKLHDAADRIRYAQDYSEKVSSTKSPAGQLAEIAFFHAAPNISKEHFKDALGAFLVASPWPQVSGLCSRLGISAMPAENVFKNLAQRRHTAAHKADASVSEVDLTQSLLDATGLAVSFDILLSQSARQMAKVSSPIAAGTELISDHLSIPLRFIRFHNSRFGEIKEGGKRFFRTHSDSAALIPEAAARSLKENGALIVFDSGGLICDWST
jgi:hypothetical protein